MAKGVGVYIGRKEVIAVSATYSIKGPQIKNYVIEPINPEAGEEPSVGKEAHKLKKLTLEAKAIHKALAKIKEPGAYVTASINPAQVVTRHFIMPVVPKKEEASAILFEANRYIPFKLADSALSYSTQTTHKNVLSVTAAAVRNDILQQTLSDLRSASCKALMIEPVYTAISRAFAVTNLVQKDKTSGFAFLQSDGNVHLTFASKGIVYLSRDFLLTGPLEEDKKRFLDELKASLDYFYKLTGGEAAQQIFLSGQGDLRAWVEYLEQAFNYSIRFDLAKLPNESKLSPDVLSSVLVAYGLAIRSLGFKSPLGEVELLPQVERRMKPQRLLTLAGGLAGIIFFLFALVRLAVFQPYIFNLQERYNKIFNSESGIASEVENRSEADMVQEFDELSARTGILRRFMQNRISSYKLLSALGKDLPRSVFFDYIAFENAVGSGGKDGKGAKRLNLRGFCYLGNAEKEGSTINGWLKNLSEKPFFAGTFFETKLEDIRREKMLDRDVTRFKIICE